MIKNLNTKHGIEVWINQQLIQTVEQEFKNVLQTDVLNYYYILSGKDIYDLKSDVKWLGSIKLVDFIKKIQSLNSMFCPIGVTNAKNKKELIQFFENDFYKNTKEIKVWDYWIGDVSQSDMICGDELFIELWNRVKEQKTKNAVTRKNFFYEK